MVRASPLALLALALAAGAWRAEAQVANFSSFQREPLITPRWQFGLLNSTSNFSASQPVFWQLLVHSNNKRVVGTAPGYEYVQINDLFVEILAGKRGGVFHVRAVAKHCTDTPGVECVGTSLWIVLSYAQFTGFGLGAAAAVALCSFALLRRMQPPPETPQERNEESIRLSVMQEHYGTVSPQPPGRASPLVGAAGRAGAWDAGGPTGLPPGGYSPPNYNYAGGGRSYTSPGGYAPPSNGGRGRGRAQPLPHLRDPGRLGPPRRMGGAGDSL
jgi:hypothetical protein